MSVGSGKSPGEVGSSSESWGGGGIESTLRDGASFACVGPADPLEWGVEFEGDEGDESVNVRDGVRVRCIGLRKETFRILSNGLAYVIQLNIIFKANRECRVPWALT